VVKIIARLELDKTISFPDGHYLEFGSLFMPEGMSLKIRGRCGFSLTGTLRPAPEDARAEADCWPACADLSKAIPQLLS